MEKNKILDKSKEIFLKYKNWIIGAAVTLTLFVTFFSLRPDGYEKLYANLTDEDKQEILAELSQRGVNYKLDETGSEIYVTKDNVDWVRKEMTDIGLPTTNNEEGYDLFTEGSLGATSKQIELQELKARKGQLEKELVRSFSFIKAATVNLNIPEDTSVFEKEEKKGSASVTIEFQKGANISKQQILGIQNMVSSAVSNIPAEEVKIIDSEKGIISGEDLENGETSSSYEKQMAIEKKAETVIHDDIKNSLSSLFGYDNIKMNVKVSINFDEIVQNIEKYGDVGVVRSKNSNKEDTSKIDGVAGEEAGTASNDEVVGYDIETDEGNIVYQQKKENIIENFEIDKTVETVKKNPQLVNKNVVVWLDRAKLDEKNIDINQFRQAVGVAAGLKFNQEEDTFENGQVVVMSSEFEEADGSSANDSENKDTDKSFFEKYGIFLGVVVLVVLILIAIIIILLKRKKKQQEIEETAIAAANQAIAEQVASQPSVNMIIGDDVDEEDNQAMIQLEKRHVELNEKVDEYSAEYPKETAEYIKKLLKERN